MHPNTHAISPKHFFRSCTNNVVPYPYHLGWCDHGTSCACTWCAVSSTDLDAKPLPLLAADVNCGEEVGVGRNDSASLLLQLSLPDLLHGVGDRLEGREITPV